MRRGWLVLALTLVAAATAPHAHAQSRLAVGIADQKATFLSDPTFRQLKVGHARFALGWDALRDTRQRRELDDWMAAARAARVEVLLTYQHSRVEGRRRVLPSVNELRLEFRALRKRFPEVVNFAVWNEANHCGEPVCHKIPLMVRYYKAMRAECPGCRILAAELLDFPNMISWTREFQKEAKVDPQYWGLHNYRDVNRLQTANTQDLLDATSGEVWLTETGGIVKRRNKSNVTFEESPAHAALATRWLFDTVAGLSPRVTRVYLYHWSSSSVLDTWDSAFVGPNGEERPALRILRRVLEDLRRPAPAPAPLAVSPAG